MNHVPNNDCDKLVTLHLWAPCSGDLTHHLVADCTTCPMYCAYLGADQIFVGIIFPGTSSKNVQRLSLSIGYASRSENKMAERKWRSAFDRPRHRKLVNTVNIARLIPWFWVMHVLVIHIPPPNHGFCYVFQNLYRYRVYGFY